MTTAAPKKRAMAVKAHLGVPTGRLAELQRETILPKPYVLTDTLVVTPPTKERADKMNEAQMTLMVYQSLLNEAIKSSASEDALNGLTKYIKEAERTYNEGFFGGVYDDVVAFFSEQDNKLWMAFQKDIQKEFFPNQPVDGKCQSCGQVIDVDAEGKASESAPSSNTGGTT